MTLDVRQKSIRSMRHTVAATVSIVLIQVAVLFIVPRLVGPADYGLFATASVILRFTHGMISNSIERALVTTCADLNNTQLLPSTVIFGVLLSALVCTAAALVASFTLHWELAAMTMCLAFAGTANLVSAVQRAALRSQFEMGRVAISEVGGIMVGAAITIGLAVVGLDATALGAGFVGGAITTTCLLTIRTSKRLVRLSRSDLVRLAKASGGFLGLGSLETAYGQLPTLLISARFGFATVGYFNRAYNLAQLPVEMLTTALTRVGVVALKELEGQHERSVRAFCIGLRLVTSLTAPLAGGLIGAGSSLVVVVLGRDWKNAADLFPLLALFSWLLMTGHLLALLAEAKGATRTRQQIQAVSLAILAPTAMLGSLLGVKGAILGMVLSAGVFLGLNIQRAAVFLRISPARLLHSLVPSVALGVLALLVSLSFEHFQLFESQLLTLTCQAAACALLVPLACAMMFPTLYSEWLAALGVSKLRPERSGKRRQPAQRMGQEGDR